MSLRPSIQVSNWPKRHRREGGTLRVDQRFEVSSLAFAGTLKKDFIMLRKIILAIAATATIGVATMGTAEARHRHRHHHNGYGLGRGYYGDRFDRGFGYGNDYYGGVYGYGFRDRFYDRYADDDFGPYCNTRRIKVKKWNHAHTRYVIVRKRVRSCY
jgi:hypothetical protein